MLTGCGPDARRQRHALRAAWRLRRRSRRVSISPPFLIPEIFNVVRIMTSGLKRIMGNEHCYLRCTTVGDPERLTGCGKLSSNVPGGFDREDVRRSSARETASSLPSFKSSARRCTIQVDVGQWPDLLSCQGTAGRATSPRERPRGLARDRPQ